jgi:hypothetical protein
MPNGRHASRWCGEDEDGGNPDAGLPSVGARAGSRAAHRPPNGLLTTTLDDLGLGWDEDPDVLPMAWTDEAAAHGALGRMLVEADGRFLHMIHTLCADRQHVP